VPGRSYGPYSPSCLEEYNCAYFAALPNPLSFGEWETLKWDVSLGRKLRRAVVGSHNTRRLLVGAVLFIAIGVITNLLTQLLTPALLAGQQSWWFRLGMLAVAIIVALVYLQWESRSGPGSPDAIEAQLSQLRSKLRSQVKDRSYGARSKLIEDRLPTLALAITPRVGWVRDPTGTEPEPISERTTDIVAAFESSRGRLLIVGEPGSGKTMAAYSLIEHLNEDEATSENRSSSTCRRGRTRMTSKPFSSTTCAPRSATRSVSAPSLMRSSAPVSTPLSSMGSTRFLLSSERIFPNVSTSSQEKRHLATLVWS
jgi:hypothetical protein